MITHISVCSLDDSEDDDSQKWEDDGTSEVLGVNQCSGNPSTKD